MDFPLRYSTKKPAYVNYKKEILEDLGFGFNGLLGNCWPGINRPNGDTPRARRLSKAVRFIGINPDFRKNLDVFDSALLSGIFRKRRRGNVSIDRKKLKTLAAVLCIVVQNYSVKIS